ncbi:hypothetical protein OG689_24735 [Kitasatospora sp. NBC_00240]|uniref:hypothetical protein n=1 Tax=Kitasatospora sp. NBC_00240 TaxID=2903567 RepID=UPI00225A8A01|nr:hypothetical protein [Kitasatospora sp. NBC_00240]MCX5212452.1 hypothetical protein [Kitasatospora sp. NBC_00240]
MVAPAPPAAPPQPSAAPALGSWGAGRALAEGAAQPAALRWFTGADWRPALRVVVAPTAVLLLAALLAAVPSNYGGEFPAPFGTRFGGSLAAALAALGAPFEGLLSMGSGRTAMSLDYTLRALPMTVTLLWALALWAGLRSGLRRRQARTGGQAGRPFAFGEAARTGLVAAAVTLVLGLLCGTRWQPAERGRPSYDEDRYDGIFGGPAFDLDAGWVQALGWTFLLAGLIALAVYGTDALRWAAWRNAGVRGWAVAGLTAGRVIATAVALASVAAFVIVAVQGEGALTLASLAFLPNLGLLLLGFGSGATFEAGRQNYTGSGYDGDGYSPSRLQYSFFDLKDLPGDWRWTGLLALATAVLLGWTAFRRRLDTADRIRLAVVHGVALSLLTLLAGAALATEQTNTRGSASQLGSGDTSSVGLAFATVLAANLIWAAAGALALPPLLARLGARRPAAGPGVTAAGAPGVPAQGGYDDGGPDAGAPVSVVPAPSDLLDSHGPDAHGPGTHGSGARGSDSYDGARPASGGVAAAEDSSVWRKQGPADS